MSTTVNLTDGLLNTIHTSDIGVADYEWTPNKGVAVQHEEPENDAKARRVMAIAEEVAGVLNGLRRFEGTVEFEEGDDGACFAAELKYFASNHKGQFEFRCDGRLLLGFRLPCSLGEVEDDQFVEILNAADAFELGTLGVRVVAGIKKLGWRSLAMLGERFLHILINADGVYATLLLTRDY